MREHHRHGGTRTMRISLTLLLSLALLVLASGGAALADKGKAKGKTTPGKARVEPPTQLSVKGRGQTLEDAEKDALERARAQVMKYLQKRQPPLRWSPSPAY